MIGDRPIRPLGTYEKLLKFDKEKQAKPFLDLFEKVSQLPDLSARQDNKKGTYISVELIIDHESGDPIDIDTVNNIRVKKQELIKEGKECNLVALKFRQLPNTYQHLGIEASFEDMMGLPLATRDALQYAIEIFNSAKAKEDRTH